MEYISLEQKINSLLEYRYRHERDHLLEVESWRWDPRYPNTPMIRGTCNTLDLLEIVKMIIKAPEAEALTSSSEWIREFRKWWRE